MTTPNTLEEIAALHDAAPAMYTALKVIAAYENVMYGELSGVARNLVLEAIRKAEGK